MSPGLTDFLDALGKDAELQGRVDALGISARRSFAEMTAKLGRERGYRFSAADVEALVEAAPAAQSEVQGFAIIGPNRASMILVNKPFNPQDPLARDPLGKVQ